VLQTCMDAIDNFNQDNGFHLSIMHYWKIMIRQ
jgi:hypothetical protein